MKSLMFCCVLVVLAGHLEEAGERQPNGLLTKLLPVCSPTQVTDLCASLEPGVWPVAIGIGPASEPRKPKQTIMTELVIVPPAGLQGVPWAALHGGPVCLAPSATFWARSAMASTRAGWPSRRRRSGAGRQGRCRWCQAASTRSRRTWPLPVLVTPPCTRVAPEVHSHGTRPR